MLSLNTSALSAMRFNENPLTCQCETERKRKEKNKKKKMKVFTFLTLLVSFKCMN